MEVMLPLEKMTIEDKIRTMETIWDDLCKNADSIKSPEWHKSILDSRDNALKKGEESADDWDIAKKSKIAVEILHG